MDVIPLPRADAQLLRHNAIAFFKERCPCYAGINLRLGEGDTLIIDADGSSWSIGNIIRALLKISRAASITIGIKYVNLFNKAEFIISAQAGDDTGDSMTATLINEIDEPVVDELDEFEEFKPISTPTSSPTYTGSYSIPEGITSLISIEEISAYTGFDSSELVASLAPDSQERYGISKGSDDYVGLFSLSNELGILPEKARRAIAWFPKWREAQRESAVQKEIDKAMQALMNSPLKSLIAPHLQPESQAATSTTVASPPTGKKRGRKPKSASVAPDVPVEESEVNASKGSRFTFKKFTDDAEAMELLQDGKIARTVQKMFAHAGDRGIELLESASNSSDNWLSYLEGIFKKSGIEESQKPLLRKRLRDAAKVLLKKQSAQ